MVSFRQTMSFSSPPKLNPAKAPRSREHGAFFLLGCLPGRTGSEFAPDRAAPFPLRHMRMCAASLNPGDKKAYK